MQMHRLSSQVLLLVLISIFVHQAKAATQADDAAALLSFQAAAGIDAGWSGTAPCTPGVCAAGSWAGLPWLHG